MSANELDLKGIAHLQNGDEHGNGQFLFLFFYDVRYKVDVSVLLFAVIFMQ